MAEQATRIKDQKAGDYIATRDAHEQDAEAHNRVIQLVDFASRQLSVHPTIRGSVAPIDAPDGVGLEDLPSDLTSNLITVGDSSILVVDCEHTADDGSVSVTPIIFNDAGDTVFTVRATKSSAIGTAAFFRIIADDIWTQMAPQLESQTSIFALAVFNGKLYGSTGANGRLFEWNGIDSWVQVAPELNGQLYIRSLVVYNNKLYGGTANGGRLFEWNGVDAWVQVALQLSTETKINSLAVFNNKLYGGGGAKGKLFEWNGVDAWTQVAPEAPGSLYIIHLAVFNNKLYGSGGGYADGGKLFEWNGVDAWVQVAPQLGELPDYTMCLAVFNNKLYGGTNNFGKLLEWNGVNAWIEVAPQLDGQAIKFLAVYNNKLYGGTADEGRLFEWNGVDAWVQVAPQLLGQIAIDCLIVFNNKLYGSTELEGRLFEWGTLIHSSPQLQWDTLGAGKIGLHISAIGGTVNSVVLKGGTLS